MTDDSLGEYGSESTFEPLCHKHTLVAPEPQY